LREERSANCGLLVVVCGAGEKGFSQRGGDEEEKAGEELTKLVAAKLYDQARLSHGGVAEEHQLAAYNWRCCGWLAHRTRNPS
jgi:hypothetical protein